MSLRSEIIQTIQNIPDSIASLPLETAVLAIFILPFIPIPIAHELIFTPLILAEDPSERLNTLFWLTVAIVLGETA